MLVYRDRHCVYCPLDYSFLFYCSQMSPAVTDTFSNRSLLGTPAPGMGVERRSMFEKFNDQARRAVVLAQEEARMLEHDYIGAEHILLGLMHDGEGGAAKALELLGISLDAVRRQVEEITGRGQQPSPGHIPFTPQAKKVLELSLRESLQLLHDDIGAEHILLGLIRGGDSVATQALVQLGGDLNQVRQQVIQSLHQYESQERASGGISPAAELPAGLLSPRNIYEELSKHVFGQSNVLRRVAVSVFRHYQRVGLADSSGYRGSKDNLLLIGPTGCGKTLIALSLSSFLKVPIAIVDATSLTEAGYAGDDVDSIFRVLLREANGDQALAEKGIVFIDEVDKIARNSEQDHTTGRDVGGIGVQQSLLAMLAGASVEAQTETGLKDSRGRRIKFGTKNILFIGAGTFNGLRQIVDSRLGASSGSQASAAGWARPNSGMSQCTQVDLETFGLMPEFAGRFTTITEMRQLDSEDYARIIRDSPDSFFRECRDLFHQFGVDLEIEEEAVSIIADSALQEHAGVRGIRRVLEAILNDVLFVLPDNSSLAKCVITSDAARGVSPPRLLNGSGEEIRIRRDTVFLGYSNANGYALNDLRAVLETRVSGGILAVHFDGRVRLSQKWKNEITNALDLAPVAILLVSPKFLSSEFVVREGLPFFLKAADQRSVEVLWVLLEGCPYDETPLVQRQAAHDISRPFDAMSADERHAVLVGISNKIKSIVDRRIL
jgi:ATP-dependent Clp protease ATP-binding subunit ClpX